MESHVHSLRMALIASANTHAYRWYSLLSAGGVGEGIECDGTKLEKLSRGGSLSLNPVK